jgi:hypothetical protein
MRVQVLAPLALELRNRLDSGALAGLGRIELSDGVVVDPERMARIIVTDVERIIRDGPDVWLTEREEQVLGDDMARLLALIADPVPV